MRIDETLNLTFLASGEFALPTLRWLLESTHVVRLVVSQPPKPTGRGRRMTPTPAAAFAREHGLPVIEPEDVNAPTWIERLHAAEADLALVIAFGQKLGEGVRGTARHGGINLHASILPKYRGAAPISWAILRGESVTGVTTFRIVDRMDAGPVLCTRTTAIKSDETAEELHDRLARIGVDAVRATLDLFADGASPPGAPQDDGAATRAAKLRKEDGVLDFDRPVSEVVRFVLGMWSWPGAAARFESADGRWENVTLARVRASEPVCAPVGRPGTIDPRLFVSCRDGMIEVLELKPASGQRMTWREYVNGRRVKAGDRFTPPQRPK
ncbi:MAG: Methionyl-tRNA formyltransferase [Phycisphaerae bacterium]|nr:Methionyl-tRNA formyltransferase [Phycisphaerae bacterium]